jgi:hypothetical protein
MFTKQFGTGFRFCLGLPRFVVRFVTKWKVFFAEHGLLMKNVSVADGMSPRRLGKKLDGIHAFGEFRAR